MKEAVLGANSGTKPAQKTTHQNNSENLEGGQGGGKKITWKYSFPNC